MVVVTPMLPPVVQQQDEELRLRLGALRLDLFAPDGVLGGSARAQVAFEASLSIGLHDGVLKLTLLDVDTRTLVTSNTAGMSRMEASQFVEDNMPLDAIVAGMSEIEIPVPLLADIVPEGAEFETVTTEGWLGLKIVGDQ